jgi:hypothetical protein
MDTELIEKIKKIVIPDYMMHDFANMYYIRHANIKDIEEEIKYLWGWSVKKEYKTDGDEIYRMIYTVDKFLNCEFTIGLGPVERECKKLALECFWDMIFNVSEDPDSDDGWIIQPFFADKEKWDKKMSYLKPCKRYKILFESVQKEKKERHKELIDMGFIPDDITAIKKIKQKKEDRRFKDTDIVATCVETGHKTKYNSRQLVLDHLSISKETLSYCLKSSKENETCPSKWRKWKQPSTGNHYTFHENRRSTKSLITNDL